MRSLLLLVTFRVHDGHLVATADGYLLTVATNQSLDLFRLSARGEIVSAHRILAAWVGGVAPAGDDFIVVYTRPTTPVERLGGESRVFARIGERARRRAVPIR